MFVDTCGVGYPKLVSELDEPFKIVLKYLPTKDQ